MFHGTDLELAFDSRRIPGAESQATVSGRCLESRHIEADQCALIGDPDVILLLAKPATSSCQRSKWASPACVTFRRAKKHAYWPRSIRIARFEVCQRSDDQGSSGLRLHGRDLQDPAAALTPISGVLTDCDPHRFPCEVSIPVSLRSANPLRNSISRRRRSCIRLSISCSKKQNRPRPPSFAR